MIIRSGHNLSNVNINVDPTLRIGGESISGLKEPKILACSLTAI